MTAKGELERVENDLFDDPGLPAHEPRPTDVDEHLEKRAERQVALLFGLSAVCTVLFCVSYFVFEIGDNPSELLGFGASNLTMGLFLGLALTLIGVGTIQWARKLMADTEIVEYRHAASSSEEDKVETLAALRQGTEESGIARRPLIRNSLLGSVLLLGAPAVIMLRDLGPLPGDKLYTTVWKRGMRVVQDVSGTPIRPQDMEVGQLVNGEPAIFFEDDAEGEPLYEGIELQQEKAKAAVVIVRMQPDDIKPWPGRENWGVDGILCYSKICTHVGCPISLWEQQTHHLLCPCHQSTFDLADNGKVIFGPAARHLPQLPLAVDDEGYLVATRDFTEAVGPSFWERNNDEPGDE
ncbi:ubiquinol-cytochrome c reductase iron-sulfur subunit [Nocardioides aurantiacus]|uniref:Cytochrome bc1 complex Rieske iron-sulfur subunit n=1 Tax=Nocardioides aurantiacus TaxID=86796 RepID=A0A3N2CSD7_9ACTN|nr:Rieske 2Fe-2S domain-containing protein [Nocardioides aurantiacus]ROR90435.1 menaquinol-cytochrome c reductase iron-sulfur subunit precursor [Nocardioides aurantiacus]